RWYKRLRAVDAALQEEWLFDEGKGQKERDAGRGKEHIAMRLVLSARLYGQRFHGRTRNGEAEWPPSPRRLYCALVAAAYRSQRPLSDAVRRALLMLERLDPPTIVAALVSGQSCLQLYVPMNSRKREPQRQKKTIMQQVLGAGDTVHYVWC